MTAPRVSVVIPTYNYARFLPEAVESVLSQDFADFELLIVDDHSSDNTVDAVKPYLSDKRINFQRNAQNLGMVPNWNFCLQAARTPYVKFLFGDDKLASINALATFVRLLDENPSAVCIGSARKIIDEKSRVIDVKNEMARATFWNGIDAMVYCLEENRNLIGEPSAVMFRKDRATRGFNVAYKQIVDFEMWFYLLLQGDFVYAPEPLVCFRVHPEQQTAVNKRNGIIEAESLKFIREWIASPQLQACGTAKMFFSQLRQVKKLARHHPEAKELEVLLQKQISAMDYLQCWTNHKLTRPLRELKNFSRKLRQSGTSV